MEGADYEKHASQIHEGDRLLLFSDGAVEIQNAEGMTFMVGTWPVPAKNAVRID
jgi:serine phosphatase RsbU (regulator of sigma subunit)